LAAPAATAPTAPAEGELAGELAGGVDESAGVGVGVGVEEVVFRQDVSLPRTNIDVDHASSRIASCNERVIFLPIMLAGRTAEGHV